MVYDTRKITHGTQEVTYGDAAGAGEVTFSTGVQKFSPSVDQDSKTIFADATTHMILMNPKTMSIETDNLQFSDAEWEQMGYTLVAGGHIDTGVFPTFSVQRILEVVDETGEQQKRLEVYYDCTSGDYTESDDEDEDEINPKVYTRTISVKGHDFNDGNGNIKRFIIERTADNAANFDKYKTKIMTPADFAAAE